MKTIDATLKSRDSTHGDFVDQAETAQRMLDCVTRVEGWMRLPPWMRFSVMMILMKISRIVHGDCRKDEHWHDIQGYARLVERELDGSMERK